MVIVEDTFSKLKVERSELVLIVGNALLQHKLLNMDILMFQCFLICMFYV